MYFFFRYIHIICEQVIPIFSYTGSFFCHYNFLNRLPNADFNVTDEYAVYTFLYNYIRQQFVNGMTAEMQNVFQVQQLPFFQDTEWQQDWQFSFADELNYTNNNQPDTTKTVMCSITDADKACFLHVCLGFWEWYAFPNYPTQKQVLQYNKCNHPHWFTIRDHVQKFYYHQGGIIVPPSMQLQWKVGC